MLTKQKPVFKRENGHISIYSQLKVYYLVIVTCFWLVETLLTEIGKLILMIFRNCVPRLNIAFKVNVDQSLPVVIQTPTVYNKLVNK